MWFRQKNAWQKNKDQQRGWLFSIAPWLVVVALIAASPVILLETAGKIISENRETFYNIVLI